MGGCGCGGAAKRSSAASAGGEVLAQWIHTDSTGAMQSYDTELQARTAAARLGGKVRKQLVPASV